jgi:hypothetical protein
LSAIIVSDKKGFYAIDTTPSTTLLLILLMLDATLCCYILLMLDATLRCYILLMLDATLCCYILLMLDATLCCYILLLPLLKCLLLLIAAAADCFCLPPCYWFNGVVSIHNKNMY